MRSRLSRAAARAGRSAQAEVALLVVTKAAPPGGLALLADLGVRDVGENRVLDAAARKEKAPRGFVWHGIGHLQTNKARKALDTFDVLHAVDSLHLADRLEAILAETDRTFPVYAQVNAARDAAKAGVAPEEALAFLRALADRPHLRVEGLMTMAREDGSPDEARAAFATLRALRDEAARASIGRTRLSGLSMGMSDDFEIAVEEGATVVRVGRAVWDGVAPTEACPPRTSPAPSNPGSA